LDGGAREEIAAGVIETGRERDGFRFLACSFLSRKEDGRGEEFL
jgi:hypothetical protein